MAPHKMNVLVYTGPGTSSESVKHCLFSLRQLLAPTYAVNPVGENHLLKEPWAATCALLVFPGGADLGYCRVLNGAGNRSITQYVRAGGRYFGFCAGSYYGSNRCEFEVGNAPLEVVGSRELAFFPGTCRGGAFKGFQYHSEKGARAIRLAPSKQLEGAGRLPPSLRCYHNGGGVFVDAAQFDGQDVKVLASYADELDVDGGDGKAAIVYCTIGKGAAVLTGPHIEFASANLTPQPDIPAYGDLLRAVKEDDEFREELLRQCLSSLGITVNESIPPVPELTPLHVTCLHPDQAAELWHSWQGIFKREGTKNVIKGGTDTFSVCLADSQKRSSNSQSPNGRGQQSVFTCDITPVLQELLLGSQQHPILMKAAAKIDGNHESEEDFNYLHNFLEQLSHKMGTDAPRGLLSSEGTRHIAHILTRAAADPKMEAFLQGSNDSTVAEVNSSGSLDTLIKQVTSDLGLVNIGSDDKTGQRLPQSEKDEGANKMIDYAAIVKELIVHEKGVPSWHEIPFFNYEVYYRALEHYRQIRDHKAEDWGDGLMYGEVLTSTNTLLDQNHGLLATLPSGFTVVARTQVAGRGRGSNVWIAPPGQMIFSNVINHSYKLAASRPIIFINYLAAIATAEGIRGLRPGCKDIPVKLKWPNDIYILSPGKDASLNESYVKIGGVLFQCSYSDGNYQVVAGIGVNAVNDRPTTCVKNYLPAGNDGCETLVEELIASILCRFEMLYKEFCRTGFSEDLEARYYAHWLHTDQIVTLEAEGGVRARIRGITRDWGLLKAEELGTNDAPTGRFWALQSDENSFDFLKGLVRRKL